MYTCKQHRQRHLRFTVDRPSNSDIVAYFEAAIQDGKVSASAKCYAIQKWGWTDALAGMFRAFRRYRRRQGDS